MPRPPAPSARSGHLNCGDAPAAVGRCRITPGIHSSDAALGIVSTCALVNHPVAPVVDVSIVVPTRNEAQNLPRLLASVRAQRGVTFDVVVVDQESEDATAEIAESFGAKVVKMPRPLFYSPPARSRN